MKQKKIGLIVAIVLAVGTGLMTLNYLSSVHRAVLSDVAEQRRIVVAAVDIPARAVITEAMLGSASRRISEIEPGALVDAGKAIGSYALISIPAGSTITGTKVGHPQNVALSVVVKRGMRAIAIGVDRVKDVAGLIQPGDRVDVIAVPSRVAGETPTGLTIVRGALVLALGAQLEQSAPATAADQQGATTVTLGVTPAQATLLAAADITTTLRLSLRSPEESVASLPAEHLILPKPKAVPDAPAAALPLALPPPVAPPPASPRVPARRVAPRPGIPVIDGAAGGP
jgi:pilus assembly protein CpaB